MGGGVCVGKGEVPLGYFFLPVVLGTALGTGRSAEESVVTPADMTGGMCFMMFMSGAEEKLSCIERTAYEDPYLATDYLTAAKMIYKGYKLVGMHIADKYATVMNSVNDALEYAKSGAECSAKYHW